MTAALAAVNRGKSLLQQSEVGAMAKAILDAIAGLEEKPAPTPTPAPPTRRRLPQKQSRRQTPRQVCKTEHSETPVRAPVLQHRGPS